MIAKPVTSGVVPCLVIMLVVSLSSGLIHDKYLLIAPTREMPMASEVILLSFDELLLSPVSVFPDSISCFGSSETFSAVVPCVSSEAGSIVVSFLVDSVAGSLVAASVELDSDTDESGSVAASDSSLVFSSLFSFSSFFFFYWGLRSILLHRCRSPSLWNWSVP